jgi:hypothetical protein
MCQYRNSGIVIGVAYHLTMKPSINDLHFLPVFSLVSLKRGKKVETRRGKEENLSDETSLLNFLKFRLRN